jgi:pyruvate dehydrogenase E2 component (dihydrolipoamide acetyltransferase)
MACGLGVQGNIVKWIKKEGDTVAPGDVLCEVETDKATIEWEAQEEGILAKILAPEGSKDIPCGTLVAVIVEEGTDISAFADFTPGAKAEAAPPTPSSPPSEPSAPATASGKSYPPHLKLEMPSLSPTMEQVTYVCCQCLL